MKKPTDYTTVTLDDLDRAPSTLPKQAGRDAKDEQIETLSERLGVVANERDDLREVNNQLRKQVGDLQSKNNTTDILNDLIKPYASKAFNFMCAYSFVVGIFVTFNAFGWCGFELEAGVMEFLVGSTAVTVIGLVGMVLTGIFVGARK